MNLLVTGGCGFIGSHFIERVIGESAIRSLVNLDALTYAGSMENVRAVEHHPKYRFEQIDLRDRSAVSETFRKHRITHVVHLAAESHVDRSIASPADFLHTNVLGTFHLQEAARALWGNSGEERFLHVSTDEVYGSIEHGAFTEASPYAPSSPYSASKASADMLVRAYHRTYGLPVLITNCGNNFGPRQHAEKLIPVIIRSVCERRSIPLYGDGQQVRDWIFVRDHAQALWQVLTRGRIGETYNVGARCERTNRAIAAQICDVIDELAPEIGGNSRALMTSVTDRPGHDRRYAIDPTRIETELCWKPATQFDDALGETVQWYLRRLRPA